MPEEAKFEAPGGYDKLEAMANALDEGGTPEITDISAAPEPTPEPTTDPVPDVAPDPAQAEPQAKGRERDPVTGKYLPKKTDPKPKEEAAPAPTDTKYEAAKKEEARQKNVLANFEKEKRQAREEQAQREANLQQRERQIQQYSAQQRPQATMHGHTAKEYYDAAQAFRKDGDFENAVKCMDAVGQIQRFEGQYTQQAQARAYDAQFKGDMEAFITEHPEFENTADSPERKMMEQVLAEFPEVYYLKNGFSRAAKIAQQRVEVESVSEFKTKLEAAEKELVSLRGKTQPVAGSPSGQPRPKNILEMPQGEAEARLQRLADEADSMAI